MIWIQGEYDKIRCKIAVKIVYPPVKYSLMACKVSTGYPQTYPQFFIVIHRLIHRLIHRQGVDTI